MKATEFEAQYAELKQARDNGTISEGSFQDKIAQLQFKTSDGVLYKIDPRDGSWLAQSGKTWQKTKAPMASQPRTPKFFPLLWFIIRRTFTIFVKQLPQMIIFAILGWVLHTFLLVFVNDGFAPATFIGNLLGTTGNSIGATVIWTVISGLFFSWMTQLRTKKGKDRFKLPPLKAYFTEAGELALAAFIAAAGICMVIGTAVNSYANVALAVGFGAVMLSQGRSVVSLLVRSAWISTYGMVQSKKAAQFGMAAGYVAIFGGAAGFVLNAIVTLSLVKLVLGLVLLGAAFFITKRGSKAMSSAIFLLFGFIVVAYLSNATTLFAHDGGWTEAGRDLIKWIMSQGAIQAIIRGIGPAIGIMLGPAIVKMLDGINLDDYDDGGEGDDGTGEPPPGEETGEPSGPVIIDYFDGTQLKNWSPDAPPDADGNIGKEGDVLYDGRWVDADYARERVAQDAIWDQNREAEIQRKIKEGQDRGKAWVEAKGKEGRTLTEEYERKQADEKKRAEQAQRNLERNQSAMIRRLSDDPDLKDRVQQLQAEGNWDEIEILYRGKVGSQIRDSIEESRSEQQWATAMQVGEVGSKIVLAGSKAALMTVGGPAGIVATAAGVGVISAAQEGTESYMRGDSTTRMVGNTIVGFLRGAKDGAIGRFVNTPGVGKLTKLFVPAAGDVAETYLVSRREAGWAPPGKAESHWQSLQKATGMGLLSIGSDLLGGQIADISNSFVREGAKLTMSSVAGGTASVIQGGNFSDGAQEGLIGGIGSRIGTAAGQSEFRRAQEYEATQRAAESRASEQRVKSAIDDVKTARDRVIPLDEQPEIIKQLNASRHNQVAVETENTVVVKPNGEIEVVQRQRIPTTLDGETATRQYVNERRALDQLSDPATSQTAKQAPQDVQDAMINTRRDKIYAPADNETIGRVAPELVKRGILKPGDKLVMDTFSTPRRADGSFEPAKIGADRDARLVIERIDADGKVTKLEVDRRLWGNQAQEDFYNHTTKIAGGEDAITSQNQPKYFDRLKEMMGIQDDPNKPKLTDRQILDMADEWDKTHINPKDKYPPPPIRHQAWAESKNQVFTDRTHAEAGMDFTDQRTTVVGGKVVQTQVEPNIVQVQRGEARLADAEGMAMQYPQKSRPYEHIDPQEGISQAQKGIEAHMKIREGYREQGYDVPPLKDKPAAAMEVIMRAPKGADATPEAMQKVNSDLEALGYGTHGRPALPDAMEKLAAQTEVVHKFSRPPAGPAPELDAAQTARIARSSISGEPASSGTFDEHVDFTESTESSQPMQSAINQQPPSRTHATPEPIRSTPEEPIAMTGKPTSRDIPSGIPKEPQTSPIPEQLAAQREHTAETLAHKPATDEPTEPVEPVIRTVRPEQATSKTSIPPPPEREDLDGTSTRVEETSVKDSNEPTRRVRPESTSKTKDIGGITEGTGAEGKPIRGAGEAISSTRDTTRGVRGDISDGIREEMGSARESIPGARQDIGRGIREDIRTTREGISGARDDINSGTREDVTGAREGISRAGERLRGAGDRLSSSREGLSGAREDMDHDAIEREAIQREEWDREQFEQEQLTPEQRMQDELLKTRDELTRQREELAKLQEELRRWRRQNEKP